MSNQYTPFKSLSDHEKENGQATPPSTEFLDGLTWSDSGVQCPNCEGELDDLGQYHVYQLKKSDEEYPDYAPMHYARCDCQHDGYVCGYVGAIS